MEKKLAEYVALIYRGHVPSGAADQAELTGADLELARAENAVFRDLERDAMRYTRAVAMDALYAQALTGDVNAINEYLKRTREPDEDTMALAAACRPTI